MDNFKVMLLTIWAMALLAFGAWLYVPTTPWNLLDRQLKLEQSVIKDQAKIQELKIQRDELIAKIRSGFQSETVSQ